MGSVVPLTAGAMGVVSGPEAFHDLSDVSFDSHVRYLSGLLLGIGIGFLSCVPGIETHTARIRLLTMIVFIGGLARLGGLVAVGVPDAAMQFGLVMELVVTPAICGWQARVSRSGPS